jgi:hypothetical protein
MKANRQAKFARALLAAASLAAGCHEQRSFQTRDPNPVLDASQDPGAHVVATDTTSQDLLASEPGPRRDWFRPLITGHGGHCPVVTTAIIKAGVDGTDLWRIGCGESAWLVTLAEGTNPVVEDCSKSRSTYCVDRLKPLE